MKTFCVAVIACVGLQMQAVDWPQFRGPGGKGVSQQRGLPATWSAEQNIVWKTPMPGFGASSPITVGKNIFVTAYSGYGQGSEVPSDKPKLRHHVVCLDVDSGKVKWDRSIPAKQPPQTINQTDYVTWTAKHGYASSSAVSDGASVFAFFGETGVIAYDLSGQELWTARVGSQTHGFGTGASPILHGNLLIVNASIESESLVVLDKKTGREVWRAPGVENSWNTPVLVDAPGRKELVVMTKFKLLSFDAATGKPLWNAEGSKPPMYVCPSAITHDGIVYAVNGYHGPAIAIRSGGSGDVTATHQVWSVKKGSSVSSPAYHDGHLYWANDQGFAICVNAATGKVVYQERVEPAPGDIYASATIADGKIYYVSRKKGTYVYAAEPKFRLLAHNVIATDESIFNASPVITDKGLLLRSDKFLYHIAK
jgi:outer membrane protein assembly factor BamB